MIKNVLGLLLELGRHVPLEPHAVKLSINVAFDDALDLVSVRGMMEVTVNSIRGDEGKLQGGSLDLVARRLERTSTAARKEIKNEIIFVTDFIKNLLMSPPSDNEDLLLRESALRALIAISATALPDELATLSKTVSVVTICLNRDWNTSIGLKALIALWYEVIHGGCSTAHCLHSKALGKRVIPDLKKVLFALGTVIQRFRKLFYPQSTCLSH